MTVRKTKDKWRVMTKRELRKALRVLSPDSLQKTRDKWRVMSR
jgi:hypothetical protein